MFNPFKKKQPNTGISIEYLPDSRTKIIVNYNKRDSPDILIIMINVLLNNEPWIFNGIVGSVAHFGQINGWPQEAATVLNGIQLNQDLKSGKNINPNARNPIISPKNVLNKLHNSIIGENQ